MINSSYAWRLPILENEDLFTENEERTRFFKKENSTSKEFYCNFGIFISFDILYVKVIDWWKNKCNGLL